MANWRAEARVTLDIVSMGTIRANRTELADDEMGAKGGEDEEEEKPSPGFTCS